eukprot:363974-Chlamydomonas_euryale.AAC.1
MLGTTCRTAGPGRYAPMCVGGACVNGGAESNTSPRSKRDNPTWLHPSMPGWLMKEEGQDRWMVRNVHDCMAGGKGARIDMKDAWDVWMGE